MKGVFLRNFLLILSGSKKFVIGKFWSFLNE